MKPHATPYKKAITLLLAFFFATLPAFASEIQVDGISGLTLTAGDDDYSLSIAEPFSVHGITFSPTETPISLRYTASEQAFGIWGSASKSVGDHAFSVTLGDSASPGIRIEGTTLARLEGSIDGDFSLMSLDMKAESTGFTLLPGTSDTGIYGTVTWTFKGEEVSLSFGTSEDPGVVIQNGAMESVEATVTSDITIYETTFQTEDLTLAYDFDTRYMLVSGASKLAFGSGHIDLSFPERGIAIFNGQLSSIYFDVVSDLNLGGLTLENRHMHGVYQSESFLLAGELIAKIGSQDIDATVGAVDSLGNVSEYGLRIQNGSIEHFDLSLSGDINLNGMLLDAHNLMMSYDQLNEEYMISGNAKARFNDFSVELLAGTPDAPGILVQNGMLADFDLSVAATPIQVAGVRLDPKSMHFVYHQTGSIFELSGAAELHIESYHMDVTVGSAEAPGIRVEDGALTHFEGAVDGDFVFKALEMNSKSAGFRYDTSGGGDFALFGEVDLTFKENIIGLDFGTPSDPGIAVSDGKLHHIQAAVTSDITLYGSTFETEALTFGYDFDTSYFLVAGTAKLGFGSDHMDLSFPERGIAIYNGRLSSMYFDVSGDFHHAGIDIEVIDMHGKYKAEEFVFGGDLKVNLEGQKIQAVLGVRNDAGDFPRHGLVLHDGNIKRMELYLDADISLKGMSLDAHNLVLAYNSSNNRYRMSGNAKATFNQFSIELKAGTLSHPGADIENGHLVDFDMSVATTPFEIGGITIHPKNMHFVYHQTGSVFELSGTAKAEVDGQMLEVHTGDETSPGVKVKNGHLEHFDMDITSDFTLKHIKFKSDGLGFAWNHTQSYGDHFVMYGSSKISFNQENIKVGLGTRSSPGMKIRDGDLYYLHMSVTSDFSMRSLALKTRNLTIDFEKKGHNDYHLGIKGTAGLQMGNQVLDLKLGGGQHPYGINIKNGIVQEIDIFVDSDLHAGSLHFQTKALELSYSHSSYHWAFSGEVIFELSSAFEVDITLGTANHPGLIVDISDGHHSVTVADLKVELKHLNLGPFDVKDAMLHIVDNTLQEVEVDVIIPGGVEVDGYLAFHNNKLHKVGLKFHATTPSAAIQLPGGALITDMSGQLDNLDHPANIVFNGELVIVYGGPFHIDNKEIVLLRATSQATVSAQGFKLGQSVLIGAYKDNHGWHSLVANMDGHMEYSVGKFFKMDIHGIMPPDHKVFELKSNVYIDADHISAFLSLDVFIPKEFPIIGGKKLASANGALQYYNHNLYRSYIAGWLEEHIAGRDVVLGARYNMGSHDVTKLGHDEVNEIRKEVASGSSSNQAYVKSAVYNAFVPRSDTTAVPHALMFNFDFGGGDLGYTNLRIIGPSRTNYELFILFNQKPSERPVYEFMDYYAVPYSAINGALLRGKRNFMIMDRNVLANINKNDGWDFEPFTGKLVAGTYKLVIETGQYNFYKAVVRNPNQVKFESHTVYMSPKIRMDKKTYDHEIEVVRADLTYYSVNPYHTKIKMYMVRDDGRGAPILLTDNITYDMEVVNHYVTGIGKSKNAAASVRYVDVPRDVKYRVYTVIDDRTSKPVKSNISDPFLLPASVVGYIKPKHGFTAPHNYDGWLVYIDANNTGRYNPKEDRIAFVESDGKFTFGGLYDHQSYRIGVLPPPDWNISTTGSIKRSNGEWVPHTYMGDKLDLTVYIYK